VQWKDSNVTVEGTPRVADILAQLQPSKDIYWPAASVFQRDQVNLEKTRQSVLKTLSALNARLEGEDKAQQQVLNQLMAEIQTWQLAKRINVRLDYDLARISLANNPMFDEGKYILKMDTRPEQIYIGGVTSSKSSHAILPSADVSDYMSTVKLSTIANKDIVHIIQPNGDTIEAPIAYWNKQHQEVMPGSYIFVPFKESLFVPEYAQLNKQIILLAQNRLTE
jgi:hypothetical protein